MLVDAVRIAGYIPVITLPPDTTLTLHIKQGRGARNKSTLTIYLYLISMLGKHVQCKEERNI